MSKSMEQRKPGEGRGSAREQRGPKRKVNCAWQQWIGLFPVQALSYHWGGKPRFITESPVVTSSSKIENSRVQDMEYSCEAIMCKAVGRTHIPQLIGNVEVKEKAVTALVDSDCKQTFIRQGLVPETRGKKVKPHILVFQHREANKYTSIPVQLMVAWHIHTLQVCMASRQLYPVLLECVEEYGEWEEENLRSLLSP